MMTNELTADNYAEALFKAVLIVADLHRSFPVHSISISSYRGAVPSRQFSLQCTIVMEEENDFTPPRCSEEPVDLCISFPAYIPRFH